MISIIPAGPLVLLRPRASPQGVQGSSWPPSPWLHCDSRLAVQRQRLVITQNATQLQELTHKIGKFEFFFCCMVRLREVQTLLGWGQRGGEGLETGLLGVQTQSSINKNCF